MHILEDERSVYRPDEVRSPLPARLHHNAWVVEDQARTRDFYEGVLGFKLTAFWIETEPFEGEQLVLSHAFYALADGSALAFFCLDDPQHKETFRSPTTQVFNHLALTVTPADQDELARRIIAAGLHSFTIDHGYCTSLYVMDPDGLRLEFTVDAPGVEDIDTRQRTDADMWFQRWTAGDRRSNNALYTGGRGHG